MAWYNPSWDYRVKITAQASEVDENISNHVYYYPLSDLPSGFWTNVKAAGADIRVTEGETTEIPAVWYDFTDNGTTGTGALFFKGTTDSSSNKDYYIYYGNSAATTPAVGDTYGRNNVWTTSFERAFLFDEDPSSMTTDSIYDHTGSGEDLTPTVGTSAGSWTSKWSTSYALTEKKGYKMDNGSARDDGNLLEGVASENDINPFNKTFITNMYRTTSPDFTGTYLWGYWRSGGDNRKLYWFVVTNGSSSNIRITKSKVGTDTINATSDNTTINTATWYRYATSTDTGGGSIKHYINGVQSGNTKSLTDSTIYSTTTPTATIGGLSEATSGSSYDPYCQSDYYMDMLLIANSEWSANRVATWDNQISAPATFWSTGTEESAPAGGSFVPKIVINI